MKHLNPILFRSVRGMGDDEKQKLCRTLNLYRLFPSDSDFTKACSCTDCADKNDKLIDFEAEMICRTKFILDNIFEISDKCHMCRSLRGSSIWSKQMLDLLHKKLNLVVSEDVFNEFLKTNPPSALLDAYRQLNQCLIDAGLVIHPDKKKLITTYDSDDECYDEQDDVLEVIETGIVEYDDANVKAAGSILLKMKEIEEEHQELKASLPNSTSQKYIEEQIRLLKTLPFDDLELRVKELIVTARRDRSSRFGKAWEYICLRSADMVSKRFLFWAKHRKNLVAGHDSNEVNKTLDLLMDQVESFLKGWEEKFGDLCTWYDRSDPKRQQTE